MKASANVGAQEMEDTHADGFERYLYLNNRTLTDGI